MPIIPLIYDLTDEELRLLQNVNVELVITSSRRLFARLGTLDLVKVKAVHDPRDTEIEYHVTITDIGKAVLRANAPKIYRGDDPKKRLTVDVNCCARCGKDHQIVFQHFAGEPFVDAGGTTFVWWGVCTNTNDPVLMTIENIEAVTLGRQP